MTKRCPFTTMVFLPTVILIVGACVFVQVAHGQQTTQVGAQGGVIQGTITRAGTGQPLKRARVSLRRAASSSAAASPAMNAVSNTQAVTDDTGRYAFTNVVPGDYRIYVDHEGYVSQQYGQRSYKGLGMVINLTPGQQLGNIDFQMVPAGSISGRILDEDGEPIANVHVQAETFSYQQGRRVLIPSGASGQTNDLGEFRIYWLMPGEYYVSATNPRIVVAQPNPVVSQQGRITRIAPNGVGVAQDAQQASEAYAPAYFPGTTLPENATLVPVPPGNDVRGIDFAVHPSPAVSVKGQVIVPVMLSAEATEAPSTTGGRGSVAGSSGMAISNAGGRQINVMLARVPGSGISYMGGGNIRGGAVHPDGSFEISNVIPGSYELGANAQVNGKNYAGRVHVEVGDAGVENLSIPLRPAISVPGRIFLDGSLPNGFKMSQLRVILQSAEDIAIPSGNNGGNAQALDDGTFLMTNVAPATYRVRVIGLPPGAYLMNGRIGGDDAVNQPFTIAGDQDVSLQLQIGFSTGQVTGTVVDEQGTAYPGALATLIPDEPARLRTDFYFSMPADQYGRFTFTNIPAGGYKLFAWEDASEGAYQDPEFIRRYEARGISIKVENATSTDQQVMITRQ